jgi:hypothetical protein
LPAEEPRPIVTVGFESADESEMPAPVTPAPQPEAPQVLPSSLLSQPQ